MVAEGTEGFVVRVGLYMKSGLGFLPNRWRRKSMLMLFISLLGLCDDCWWRNCSTDRI